ncbi:nose resistant to fluoxetine protein 6-like [Dermacentor andersoni]|uniref:nose resistant to fluoxetine protein 6-like n=1 Tax=Dermacentor andersoni TaxID=34620 RepID=UPI0024180421|nr:nose resistant to fluoxetine protein 6-like [Dermacentor andersoni]
MAAAKAIPRVSLLCLLIVCLPAIWCYDEGNTTTTTTPQPDNGVVKKVQAFVASIMDKIPPDVTRKLLTAEVSPTCSIGLLKLVGAIRRVEPWALRLIDAMGKYPTGLMQATKADLGAFDECVETVVRDSFGHEVTRGQYCNLDMRISKGSTFVEATLAAMGMAFPQLNRYKEHITDLRLPPIRLGICVTNDCNEEELQELINKMIPPAFNLKLSNCVTSLPVPLTNGQKAILITLGVLVALLAIGTVTDVCVRSQPKNKAAYDILLRCLRAFSLISNTKVLLQVVKDKSSDAYTLRFFHGLRFFSLTWIVLGHCYGSISPTWSRLLNNLLMAQRTPSLVVPAAYVAVDTFFFLSAFLLCYTISKQKKPAIVVFIFAVIRRFIRTMVPVFFLLMCMYLLPVITSGPDAKSYFEKFYDEMNRLWLDILLQIQNYRKTAFSILVHLWYLSVDFQLFLISLPIAIILKNRQRWAIGVFILLSIVSCSISAWQISGTHNTPFVIAITETMSILEDTLNNYYMFPFYHGVCYFSGCITFYLLQGFKNVKLSKIVEALLWIVALVAGAGCVFDKQPWYRERHPTSEVGKLCVAFFDRILWSVCLSWITLACATGRGGYINKFLSWNAFVPLSRLTFGVYLIHYPFIILFLHISRERMLFSHFTLVSLSFAVLLWSYCLTYLMFVLCEAPTAQLDKLIFMGAGRNERRQKLPLQNGAQLDKTWVVPTESAVEKGQTHVDLESGNNNNNVNGIVGQSVTYHL